MKFSITFPVALLSFAKFIVADSESFGFVSIRSGSSLQYAYAYVVDNSLMLGSPGSDKGISGVVTDAGTVKLSDGSFIVVASDGAIKAGSETDATAGFSIQNGALDYENSSGFYAIPEGSAYIFSTASSSDATGVLIKAMSTSGQSVPDFNPDITTSITTTAAPTQTGNSTSTIAPFYNTTTYYPSNNGSMTTKTYTDTATATDTQTCSSCPIIQTSTNGVKKVASGMGAGIVAAAAALLL